MSVNNNTGNQTTFVVADAGDGATPPYIGRIVAVGAWGETWEVIDDDDLSTTSWSQKMQGDFANHEGMELTIVFDIPDDLAANPVHMAGTFLGTLTMPLRNGYIAPASLAGTGFFTGRTFSGMANNERIEGAQVWQFDGGRPNAGITEQAPTWTAPTPTPPPA